MGNFRNKPVVIQAVQLRWDTWGEVCSHAGVGRLTAGQPQGTYIQVDGNPGDSPTDEIGLLIPTLEGLMVARPGDWIIKGVKGELYPCKPDIFEATYEPESAEV